MSTDEEATENDKCRVITDVALDTAIEECGSEEAVKRQVMDMFGFTDDEDEPTCEEILERGLTDDVLDDIDAQREYAMCRAWKWVNEGEMAFRSAINSAWAEIRNAEQERG